MRFIAFTVKGLEQIAKDEIKRRLPDASITEVGAKRVIFEVGANIEGLLTLQTVDDICILLGKIPHIESKLDILDALGKVDFQTANEFIRKFRRVNDTFSVTTTILGLKNITSTDLANDIGRHVANQYHWTFTEADHSNFDIRVFVERALGYIAVRLTEQSLMHRNYKTASKPGSLRSTVAASMIVLATEYRSPLQIVDNFCGSGTILCEALIAGYQVFGGDIDPQSIEIAKTNLGNLGYQRRERIRILDAMKSPWPENFFDCAVSNLPWGKQIPLASVTRLYDRGLKEYARVVKREGTVCLLVPKPELLIKYARKYFSNAQIRSIPISFTGQSPTIIVIRR